MKSTWRGVLHKGRDHARTPMQWSAEENAGFTTGEPWIMVNPNYKTINAKTEADDANSILNFYKALIALRNGSKTLQYGDYEPLWNGHAQLFCLHAHAGKRNLHDRMQYEQRNRQTTGNPGRKAVSDERVDNRLRIISRRLRRECMI